MSILSILSIPGLIEDVCGILSKHISDPAVMAEVKAQLAGVIIPESVAQAQIESQNQTSKYDYIRLVRATCEWIAIYGLFVGVVVTPLLTMFGYPSPVIPMPMILNLLYALLGLGATRIAETLVGNKL